MEGTKDSAHVVSDLIPREKDCQ